jgi:hypothetical protein
VNEIPARDEPEAGVGSTRRPARTLVGHFSRAELRELIRLLEKGRAPLTGLGE